MLDSVNTVYLVKRIMNWNRDKHKNIKNIYIYQLLLNQK